MKRRRPKTPEGRFTQRLARARLPQLPIGGRVGSGYALAVLAYSTNSVREEPGHSARLIGLE